MADEREAVNSTARPNNENPNRNASHDLNYQAWMQYWEYYYASYMYHYTNYYYMALCQNQTTLQNPLLLNRNVGTGSSSLNGSTVDQADPLNNIPVGRNVNQPNERFEYKIAPVGKRVIAEFIDFVFLYFLKYVLCLLFYKDPDRINSQFQYILIIDDNTSIKDLEDVILQALIYRFIVFLYETLFLAMAFPCNIGGASLGKYMMGITVVLYSSMTPIEGQNLRRFTGNADRISLWQSCARSTLKNFMITFFFPVIFTTMFLQNYRTPYDFVANSIVIDANPKRLVDQAP